MIEITKDDIIKPCPSCKGTGSIEDSGDKFGYAGCSACSATGRILTEIGRMAKLEIDNLIEQQQRERAEARGTGMRWR